MEFENITDLWEILSLELDPHKQTFIAVLHQQIAAANHFRKKHLAGQQITPPSQIVLDTCYREFMTTFTFQFTHWHHARTIEEIHLKVKPWAFFVGYGLSVYYSCQGRNFDEKMLLITIFTLVKAYDDNFPFPNQETLNNYLHILKPTGTMNKQDLARQVEYLLGQIEAKLA